MSEEDIQEAWRDEAACEAAIKEKPYLAGAWIAEDHPYRDDARKICLGCKVRIECLMGALQNEEAEGMRGGYWFDAGKLPVAVAREIRDTMDLEISPWQSTGRPKK